MAAVTLPMAAPSGRCSFSDRPRTLAEFIVARAAAYARAVTSPPTTARRERLLSPAYAATTIAVFALIAFNAFETMAVTTVMPTISRDLDGLGLYAVAFAAPLASSVVGMVAAGMWSDRRGPAGALLVSLGRDRGFNSSALTIADAMGAALALSVCGIGFTLADRAGGDPFLAVFGVAVGCAATAVVTAARLRPPS